MKKNQFHTLLTLLDNGFFDWKALAFRSSGACATYNRILNKLLERFRHFTSGYFDDVLVFSSSWLNRLRDVANFLKAIKVAGLNLNRYRYEFGKAVVDLLGFRVGLGSVEPRQRKVEDVINSSRPTSKKEIPMMRSRIILSKMCFIFSLYFCRIYIHA